MALTSIGFHTRPCKMAAHFSSVLQLTDLDDFILPSQECIKPVTLDRTTNSSSGGGKIQLEVDGSYVQLSSGGQKTKLQKAKITLNDCLACSGCITSAESVLISQQSHEEFYRIMNEIKHENPKKSTVIVSISPQVTASLAVKYKMRQYDALMRLSGFFKKFGADYVFDSTFARNFSLIESQREFVQRYISKDTITNSLPMLCGSCPGWICYAEKTHGSFILPYISTTKSPQQVMGSLVKEYLASQCLIDPKDLYHVSIEPCFDKKLEASRQDFLNKDNTKDVDCVITSIEVDQMLQMENLTLNEVQPQLVDEQLSNIINGELCGHSGSGSGGFAEHIFRYAAKQLFDIHVDTVEFVAQRNPDLREAILEKNGEVLLRFAIANGFRNIQNLVQKIKRKKCNYDYVEVMACPSGCLNGGAQIRTSEGESQKDLLHKIEASYDEAKELCFPEHNPRISQLYRDWLEATDESHAHVLHTSYHAIEKSSGALNIKW